MIGSATIGAWIALAMFWIVLGIGWGFGELSLRGAVIFVVLWVAVNIGLRLAGASNLFPSIIALVDVVLVLIVFKGDIRLT